MLSMNDKPSYTIGSPRRSWVAGDDNSAMNVHVSIRGSIPLGELIEYLYENMDDISGVMVTAATVRWNEPPTTEEIEERQRRDRDAQERHERWERTTYARLRKKFGPQGE